MVGVEADLLGVVSDAADRVADRALDVQLGVRGHLADHHAQALGDRGLACDPCVGVLRQHSIEHRVRDLVADFVRVPLGDGFRGHEK